MTKNSDCRNPENMELRGICVLDADTLGGHDALNCLENVSVEVCLRSVKCTYC